jgi:hypothetical protein
MENRLVEIQNLNLLFMKVSKENLQTTCPQRIESFRKLSFPTLSTYALFTPNTRAIDQNEHRRIMCGNK